MNAIIHPYHLEPGTLIAYEGYQVVVTGPVKGGIAVRDRFIGDDETVKNFVIEDKKLNELLLRNDVEIDVDFSSDDPNLTPEISDEAKFEDLPAAERLVALQKEAYCLAVRAVLGPGCAYHPKAIADRSEEIEIRALDRQRLNCLGTMEDGAFEARTWKPKSISNFCKDYFGMQRPHPRILLNKKSKGNTTKRLTPAQDRLLDETCNFYLNTAQPSGASIERLVKKRFAEVRSERRAAGDDRPFPTPHRNTVYRRLNRFSRLELVIGREGYRAAQKEFSPTQHGVRALKPGEMIELDFWKGDVFTFSEKSKFWDLLTPDLQKVLKDGKGKGKKKKRQRLWICLALDVATRMPLGVGIAEKPNSRTVIEVLDMVMRDKSDVSRLAECKMPWSHHTGLGTVVVDTGAEFFNDEVQTAITAAGGSFIYGRAAVPMDKPFVERNFGGMRTLFADELPGKTGYSPDCLVGYDKEGMAAFNAEQFRLLLVRYLVDFYPLREHAGLFGKRPIDAWKDAQKYRVVAPPLPRVRRNATGLKVQRMLTKEGVRICGLPFGDPMLFPRYLKNGKFKVEVRVDPNDLREVTIVVDGKQIHLENRRPDLAHHSIRTLMAAIKEMTQSDPRSREFYEYVLAAHADRSARQIQLGIQAHGLPSTEVTPEELDWFENSHCLKLHIAANPDRTPSADVDELFSGGTGAGIYTAEDIAKEQLAEAEPGQAPVPDGMADAAPQVMTPEREDPVPDSSERDEPLAEDHQPSAVERKKETPATSPKRRFSGTPKGKGKFT